MADSRTAPATNHILAGLSVEDGARVRALLKPVELLQHDIVHEAHEPLLRIFFVESGMVSLVSTTGKGAEVETGIVGREGASGMALFHGVAVAFDRGVVQVAGHGHSLEAPELASLITKCASLRAGLHRYAYGLHALTSYASACNRRHRIDQRLARWLLLVHDRVGAPQLPITHHFVAQMLGVRRSSVTIVAEELRESRLIDYKRGKVTIVDRPGLERVACDCYRAMQVAFRAAGLPHTVAA